MTERWYYVSSWRNEIAPVEVVKETAQKVAIITRWCGKEKVSYRDKNGSSERYFKTYTEARDFVIDRAQTELKMVEERVKRAVVDLSKAQSIPLEEPA